MGGARQWAGTPLSKVLLLGGSFNPAHTGHRHISLNALQALQGDEIWWMVSPGNPLKSGAKDMAPLPIRLRSAQKMAARSRIRPTAIETQFCTRFTVDTLAALLRHFPHHHFIWLMGEDNLAQFHRWKQWRKIAKLMPIAVIARPGYTKAARASRAKGWFRWFVRPASQARCWTHWRTPALVQLRFRPDASSATALRRANPDWQKAYPNTPVRDAVTRRLVFQDI